MLEPHADELHLQAQMRADGADQDRPLRAQDCGIDRDAAGYHRVVDADREKGVRLSDNLAQLVGRVDAQMLLQARPEVVELRLADDPGPEMPTRLVRVLAVRRLKVLQDAPR